GAPVQELLDQLVPVDAERLGAAVDVEPVAGLVLDLGDERHLTPQRGSAGDPVALRQHADDLRMRVLRHHSSELLAIALGHPVLGLDALAGGDAGLEGVDEGLVVGRGRGVRGSLFHDRNIRKRFEVRQSSWSAYLPFMTDSTASKDVPRAVDEGDVRVEIADGVGAIEFQHPKGNSLPGPLLRWLADGIAALGSDDSVRVIVLRSGGTGPFCAGASFAELKRVSTPEEGREF